MFKVLLTILSLTLASGPLLASGASIGKGSCCGTGHCATAKGDLPKACCQPGGQKSGSAPVVPPQYELGKLTGFSSLGMGVAVAHVVPTVVVLGDPTLRTQGPPLFVIHNSFLI